MTVPLHSVPGGTVVSLRGKAYEVVKRLGYHTVIRLVQSVYTERVPSIEEVDLLIPSRENV